MNSFYWSQDYTTPVILTLFHFINVLLKYTAVITI